MTSSTAGLPGNSGGEAQAEHTFTNRLAQEQSPYLLQHAHNPVDWYPWGEEAFSKARAENKLIFLSVGYSTCHWCHVMEEESFESEEVAGLLNDHFVSIKVDREERPDVDKVYMTYVQATSGGGGWPMSVFLTPGLQPVLGGTYFPPEDKHGRVGFKSLLRRVHQVWTERRTELERSGEEVVAQLAEATRAEAVAGEEGIAEKLPAIALEKGAQQLSSRFDPKLGGFGSAPKFPRPCEIDLLLHHHFMTRGAALPLQQSSTAPSSSGGQGASTSAAGGAAAASGGGGGAAVAAAGARSLHAALFTLRAMAAGGMHDHVGGGFHRYSVDEHWHVPHFEKMLYDQGQLATSYLDAFSITKDPQYAIAARDPLDYLRRRMIRRGDQAEGGGGGIFSAEDADSLEGEKGKKKEGAFYVWTKEEIDRILGAERSAIFCAHYYVKAERNCDLSVRSDPHEEFSGKNVLIERQTLGQTVKSFGTTEEEAARLLGQCRKDLYAAREMRPLPHLDDKIIVAWNSLSISAFAKASRVLASEPSDLQFAFPVDGCEPSEYLATATRAASFLRSNLFCPDSGRLRRSFRSYPSPSWAFADDYAFLISALLDLFEAGGDVAWLEWALELQQKQDELFLDPAGGAYFSSSSDDPSLLLRMKEDYDGAEPSPNSYALANLLRLAEMVSGTESAGFLSTAKHTAAVFQDRFLKAPMALPRMCCSLSWLAEPSKRQVIIAGKDKEDPALQALVDAAFAHFDPHRVVIQIDPSNKADVAFWEKHNPRVLKMASAALQRSEPLAFVCKNFACQAPTTDPEIVRSLMQPGNGAAATAGPKISTVKLVSGLRVE